MKGQARPKGMDRIGAERMASDRFSKHYNGRDFLTNKKSNMKERPILFQSAMVRAILEGSKTQTRRAIKPKPDVWIRGSNGTFGLPYKATTKKPSKNAAIWQEDDGKCYEPIKCPYGSEGTRLWVRETFYAYGKWVKNGITKKGKQKFRFVDETRHFGPYRYADSPPETIQKGRVGTGWFKRPSLFMPRDASRITLEIVSIQAQRLQDITEQDAIAEGIEGRFHPEGPTLWAWRDYAQKERFSYGTAVHPRSVFKKLWEKINGPGSWQENPWTWRIEFKKV